MVVFRANKLNWYPRGHPCLGVIFTSIDGAGPKANVNSLIVGDNHPWSLEVPFHQAPGVIIDPCSEEWPGMPLQLHLLHALYLIRVPSVDLTLCHFDSLLQLSRPGLSIILEPAC
jgi:hypothetical protein